MRALEVVRLELTRRAVTGLAVGGGGGGGALGGRSRVSGVESRVHSSRTGVAARSHIPARTRPRL